jgi:cytochrome c biogenesis protein CcmG/thiol:disulfide interchange protein DsbE
VILVDFWASWCPPCRESLPKVAKLFQDDHAKGLEVVGISNDDSREDLKNFLLQNKEITWPQIYQQRSASGYTGLTAHFAISEIPTMFVIDRNGILREVAVGYFPDNLVAKLLDESASPTTAPTAMAK